jgi:phosphoglycerate dehydrogenase-like enzyme/predicted dehydrogenase
MTGQQRPLVVIPSDDPPQIGDSPQLKRLEDWAEVRLFRDRAETADEQLRRARGAEVIINSRGYLKWPRELLAQLPSLKMITTCGVGFDAIDIAAAAELGILACNVPEKTAPVVAEHALALMLAAARQIPQLHNRLHEGHWDRADGVFLRGKTLGVIGTGAIGSEVLRLGHLLGMRTIAWTYHPSRERADLLGVQYVGFDELLSLADIVSLHVRLTPESWRLIGRAELAKMKRGAVLVNTARGDVVAMDALCEALDSGHLGAAALDVYDREPLPADHPILRCPRVVLTPHSADQTPEGIDLLNAGAVENVLAYLDGKTQHVVNRPEVEEPPGEFAAVAAAPAAIRPAVEPKKPYLAPDLPYKPRDPQHYHPPIGLIGCGGITKHHLKAYRDAGYRVVALCDLDLERAKGRQKDFFPEAEVCTDYRAILKRDDIEVVDITPHPHQRPPIVEAAVRARKHVLSQKPFVLDLDVGERLVDLADQNGVYLAVNQNGRWAPHFSYMREAVKAGLLGEIAGIHLSVHWDHSWVRGTEFEKVKHLILYDYAIHWFDIISCLMQGHEATRVFACVARTRGQTVAPSLLGQAVVEYPTAQASLAFDAETRYGTQDRSFVAGSHGAISSIGPGNRVQRLTITTEAGDATPELEGSWFPDGFHGTMGELLCAIEEKRQPSTSARDNLRSLSLCFAAVASAERHEPVVPGTVRAMPE